MIEVCCAIILKESKLLAVQRGPKSSHPWKWEFPGGKINPDEGAEQGMVREIEEELSIRVVILDRLASVEFAYEDRSQICLIPFVCKILSGEINLTEHVAQRWFSYEEWESLDWQDADRQLILRNLKRLQLLTP